MDAIGGLFEVLFYFGVTIGPVGSALARLSERQAPPGASPWRLRAPRLALWAAPTLFVAAFPLFVVSAPVSVALLFASLAAPIVAFVMVAIEWLRRRCAATSR